MVDRVLILSASAGAGHVRAAQAIERAIQSTGAAREVRHVDALDFTNKVFRRLYGKGYLDMVEHMPVALGWVYDKLDTPWEKERRRLFVDKLNTRPLVGLLREWKPDLAICTHFLPSEIISWLKAKRRTAVPQAIVVTDFDVHAMWLCHHYEHYFVALPETATHLEKLGIPRERVTVSGIPIDPAFAVPRDRREMRARHGFPIEPPLLLVSAGGFGMGATERIFRGLLDLEHEATIVVVCGRNEELRRSISLRASRDARPHQHVHVLGFTTEMHELMAAADLLIGKPGGLTTSEALATGLPLCIVSPIPGQEERNADHLLEEGAAIRCNNLPVLGHKLDRLLEDPERRAALVANARRLGRPRAAFQVVERAIGLARGEGPTARA
ncbi:MAG: glycosyltransferase [Acidobacteriota bacterium]